MQHKNNSIEKIFALIDRFLLSLLWEAPAEPVKASRKKRLLEGLGGQTQTVTKNSIGTGLPVSRQADFSSLSEAVCRLPLRSLLLLPVLLMIMAGVQR